LDKDVLMGSNGFKKFSASINPVIYICFTLFVKWAILFLAFLSLSTTNCTHQIRKYPLYPEKKIPQIRVALDDNLESATLAFQNEYRLLEEEATYILNESLGTFSLEYSNNKLVMRSSKRQFEFKEFKTIEFLPVQSGSFIWNKKPYLGKISFAKIQNKIVVINILPVPDYLGGVVQYEIPTGTEEYYPAIKAQTVAARSYALYHIKYPATNIFDVYNDSRDQVYQGSYKESPLVSKAIEETFGLVLQNYSGEVEETQFHSTCGGTLDLRAEYLASKELYGVFLNDSSDGSYNCLASPLYRWVKKVKTTTILRNINRIGKISAGKVNELLEVGFELGIDIMERNSSGRIEKVMVKIDDLEVLLSSWQVRQVFSPDAREVLPSTLFLFKSSPQEPDAVYLIGGGFGHGKGMCQWGAIGMALKNRSFQEILAFYYPGLKMNKIY
jgi:stage II sporulation protein D